MIEEIHDRIREDLLANREDLFKLRHYYTHKWRSNCRLIDINVGLFYNEQRNKVAQIYVADKNTRIREQIILTEENNLIDTDIIIKRYE